jgi:hypothetical protein
MPGQAVAFSTQSAGDAGDAARAHKLDIPVAASGVLLPMRSPSSAPPARR